MESGQGNAMTRQNSKKVDVQSFDWKEFGSETKMTRGESSM